MRRNFPWIALLCIVGCAPRARLTETHGLSTRASFARQVANPAAVGLPPRGLDSQESSIVAETFRDGLAPKGAAPKDTPLVLVAPPVQGGAAKRALAPSVPDQR